MLTRLYISNYMFTIHELQNKKKLLFFEMLASSYISNYMFTIHELQNKKKQSCIHRCHITNITKEPAYLGLLIIKILNSNNHICSNVTCCQRY